MLLSAAVEGVGVSRRRDFFNEKLVISKGVAFKKDWILQRSDVDWGGYVSNRASSSSFDILHNVKVMDKKGEGLIRSLHTQFLSILMQNKTCFA